MSRRVPLAGEHVQTPEGEGVVLGVVMFEMLTAAEQKKQFSSLRAMFGDGFKDYYFRASVQIIEGGEVKSFEVWEIEYDSERDPEDAPWREPRSDS